MAVDRIIAWFSKEVCLVFGVPPLKLVTDRAFR